MTLDHQNLIGLFSGADESLLLRCWVHQSETNGLRTTTSGEPLFILIGDRLPLLQNTVQFVTCDSNLTFIIIRGKTGSAENTNRVSAGLTELGHRSSCWGVSS